jgi:hypothetical protein
MMTQLKIRQVRGRRWQAVPAGHLADLGLKRVGDPRRVRIGRRFAA